MLLINRAWQFGLAGKYDIMLKDHGFDKVIDLWLPSNGIIRINPPQQARAEADGQVVGLHHVLVAVLSHAVKTRMNEMVSPKQAAKKFHKDILSPKKATSLIQVWFHETDGNVEVLYFSGNAFKNIGCNNSTVIMFSVQNPTTFFFNPLMC